MHVQNEGNVRQAPASTQIQECCLPRFVWTGPGPKYVVSTRPGLNGPKKQFQPAQISNSGYPSATLEVELGFVVVDLGLSQTPNFSWGKPYLVF